MSLKFIIKSGLSFKQSYFMLHYNITFVITNKIMLYPVSLLANNRCVTFSFQYSSPLLPSGYHTHRSSLPTSPSVSNDDGDALHTAWDTCYGMVGYFGMLAQIKMYFTVIFRICYICLCDNFYLYTCNVSKNFNFSRPNQ